MANEVSITITADPSAAEAGFKKVKSGFASVKDSIVKNRKAIGVGLVAMGAGIEALAKNQQVLTESTLKLANATGMSEKEIRGMATSLSNATFPLDEALALMKLGAQQGLESAESLKAYAGFWDTIGDATGLSSEALAKSGAALAAVGVEVGNESELLGAFGLITQESTQSVQDFLNSVSLLAPELSDVGVSVDEAAVILTAMEREMGLTARTARTEFKEALEQSETGLAGVLEQLGLSEDQFATYQTKLEESTGVMGTQADALASTKTVMDKLKSSMSDLMFANGELIEKASMLAPLFLAAGPIVAGFSGIMGILTPALHAAKIAFIGLNLSMGVVSLVILGITAAIAAGILIWKNWDTVIKVVKETVNRVGNFLIDMFNKITFVYRKQITVFLEGVQALLNVASKLPGVGDKFDGLADTIQLVIDKVDAGIPNFELSTSAMGDMADTAGLAATEFDDLGVSVAKVAGQAALAIPEFDSFGTKLDELGESAATTAKFLSNDIVEGFEVASRAANQLFAGEEESTLPDRWSSIHREAAALKMQMDELVPTATTVAKVFSNDIVQGYEAAQRAANQLFTAEENLDAAMTGRQKQRAIDLANTELALDASLAKLRGNLDTTALAWKKSGATMDDVIKAWSKETGLSIDEVIDRMDDLDVDTTDLQATLETFTDETGANFWDMAKEAREALQQIADDLQMDKSWEGFIRGQDETVIAMRENSISFNDIMGELVGQFEGDTDAMVAALKEAGVAGQDTWGLLGSSFGSVVRDIVDGWDEIVDAADDSAKRLAAIAMQAAAMQAAAPAMQKSGWAVNPVGASFDTAVFNKFSEEQKNIARGIDWDALSNAQLQEMAQSSQEIIRLSASHQRFKRGGGSSGYRAGNVLTSESGTWANFQAAKLALGGIVNRPTLAMLGESGPEAVIPLGRGGGAGMTVNLVINGDINGMDDFEQKVSSVIRDAVLGGGFSGVLARA